MDLTSRLSVRGGYRAVWSDTQLQSQASGENQAVSLSRDIGLAGFSFRLPRKTEVSLDFESGQGDRVFSRTDILDYRKVRLRGRYRPWDILTVSGAFSLMDHENTRPDLGYDFESRGFTVSVSLARQAANASRRTSTIRAQISRRTFCSSFRSCSRPIARSMSRTATSEGSVSMWQWCAMSA